MLRVFTGRRAPLPADIVARGISRAALQAELPRDRMLYAVDLRRLGHVKRERRRHRNTQPLQPPDDEAPFGWLPPPPPDDEE